MCVCAETDCVHARCASYKAAKKEEEKMPEFMTPKMRETIGANVLRPEHTAKIKGFLARSDTACDDTHQFNPSRFDMEHAMRINLKKDCEAPAT